MFDDFFSSVISNDIDNTYVEVLFFIMSKESEDFLDLTQLNTVFRQAFLLIQ